LIDAEALGAHTVGAFTDDGVEALSAPAPDAFHARTLMVCGVPLPRPVKLYAVTLPLFIHAPPSI